MTCKTSVTTRNDISLTMIFSPIRYDAQKVWLDCMPHYALEVSC